MYTAFIVVYVIIMTSISIISMGKIKGVSDFLLGGCSINPWMSAFSYGTAYFSAVLFIGYEGLGYLFEQVFGIPNMRMLVIIGVVLMIFHIISHPKHPFLGERFPVVCLRHICRAFFGEELQKRECGEVLLPL